MKRQASKSSRPAYTCSHCEVQFDFPVGWCRICKDHRHDLFMSRHLKAKPQDICSDCWNGITTQGQKWRREQMTWRPDPHFESSWDWPEWYDIMEEWKCSTIQDLWNEENDGIPEL